MLIAASAREIGAIVVTENRDDFAILSTVIDIKYVDPWPDSSLTASN